MMDKKGLYNNETEKNHFLQEEVLKNFEKPFFKVFNTLHEKWGRGAYASFICGEIVKQFGSANHM